MEFFSTLLHHVSGVMPTAVGHGYRKDSDLVGPRVGVEHPSLLVSYARISFIRDLPLKLDQHSVLGLEKKVKKKKEGQDSVCHIDIF